MKKLLLYLLFSDHSNLIDSPDHMKFCNKVLVFLTMSSEKDANLCMELDIPVKNPYREIRLEFSYVYLFAF